MMMFISQAHCRCVSIVFVLLSSIVAWSAPIIAPDAKIERHTGFRFTEGPAAAADGNVYFTDIPNNRIHIWHTVGERAGTLSTFREESGATNGLMFDREGRLLGCQGATGRIVRFKPDGSDGEVLAGEFDGRPLNKTNDLWIDPKGGIYFSDPAYGYRDRPTPQPSERVYYLTPDQKSVVAVINDFKRPNGLVGTPDGKTLYATDIDGKRTWRYAVQADGSLTSKTLFCEYGSDGMTIDVEGNVYLTEAAVLVFNPAGELIQRVETPERPANVAFGGPNNDMLFITARTSLYSVKTRTRGAARPHLPEGLGTRHVPRL